jgi:hypothetical protein
VQFGVNALGEAAFHGHFAFVEFLLGCGFDLEAKDNVRLHLSYIACFFLFSLPIIGAINACSLLQRYESAEVSKTSVVTCCECCIRCIELQLIESAFWLNVSIIEMRWSCVLVCN